MNDSNYYLKSWISNESEVLIKRCLQEGLRLSKSKCLTQEQSFEIVCKIAGMMELVNFLVERVDNE